MSQKMLVKHALTTYDKKSNNPESDEVELLHSTLMTCYYSTTNRIAWFHRKLKKKEPCYTFVLQTLYLLMRIEHFVRDMRHIYITWVRQATSQLSSSYSQHSSYFPSVFRLAARCVFSSDHFPRMTRFLKLISFSKSMFHFGLFGYHAVDFYFDWRGYYALKNNEAFAVVPKGNSIARSFYLISCVLGTIFGLAMMIVYGYYILYHVEHVRSSGDYNEPKRVFLNVESFIIVCELLFKDDIQSILVCLIYHSDPRTKCVSFLTKAFTVCSIMAHTKLLLGFSSKLFGIGAGEKFDTKCENKVGSVLGFLGCAGTLVFLVLTSLKFADMQNWLPYDEHSSSNCTRYSP